jgi:hypothetical protein
MYDDDIYENLLKRFTDIGSQWRHSVLETDQWFVFLPDWHRMSYGDEGQAESEGSASKDKDLEHDPFWDSVSTDELIRQYGAKPVKELRGIG